MSKEIKAYEVKLTDLLPDPDNANRGTERGQYMIDTSVQETGLHRGVAVDTHNVLVAGNKTHQAALDAGFTRAVVVETDGETLVVTKRTDFDLSDEAPDNKARKAAYFDNRTSEFSDWDIEQIAADVEVGLDLSAMFYDDEVADLVRRAEEEADAALAPPPPRSERLFTPEYNPQMSSAPVTREAVGRAGDRMGRRFDESEDTQVELICPHCGELFYVNKAELR